MTDDANAPRLARRVRLRADPARGGHVLLFPEGVLVLNESAAEVLALVDGARTLRRIADELAQRHGAPDPSVVLDDVRALLERLGARGFVEGVGAAP
ncbi:MAG: pyrroloquinoline quinone biosynthesis peptide chaperone PqqD [Polyangiales bacterium]